MKPHSSKQAQKRKKKARGQIMAATAALLLLCVVWAAGIALWKISTNEAPVSSFSADMPASASGSELLAEPASPLEPEQLRISFSAVGDNLIHDGIYLQAGSRAGGEGYDFEYVYENLRYFFEDFDVNWINQETLVNTQLAPSSYPCFSTPGELGTAAYNAGWRVFSLSNNHTYDKLSDGISATMDYWQNMPEDVLTPGLFNEELGDGNIQLHEVNGITLAYLSYTEYTNGIPTPQNAPARVIYTSERELMQAQVQRAAELADAVVVGVHWGVEGSHTVTPAQQQLAADIAAWGATVIIGTHPHVIQPVEWIPGRDGQNVLVAYSLGNFLSAQSAAENMVGLALCFDLSQTKQPDGTRSNVTVENVRVYPTVTHYDANYTNIRDYMLRDYTEDLAAQHGVRARNPAFSMAYITELAQTYIDAAFLVLD